ncbi:MAG: thioesterase [Candidatus Kapaibacterium sp.]|nr:MAG: thioesterase [Candidatus Kapabacteria bacterium]
MKADDTSIVAHAGRWQPQTPNFRAVIAACLERQHFMKHIGCRLTVVEPGYVEASIEIGNEHLQHDGLVHGGVIATIADVVAGFASYTLVAEDQYTVTVDLMLSYLEAVRPGVIRACGRVIRHGRTISVVRTEIVATRDQGNDQLVAIAQATFAIRVRS